MEMVCVHIGHAGIFSSALSHCGGENKTEGYVYVCLLMLFQMRWITRRG